MVPIETLGVGDRSSQPAGEKRRCRPQHLSLLKKSKFDTGWLSHLVPDAFEVAWERSGGTPEGVMREPSLPLRALSFLFL